MQIIPIPLTVINVILAPRFSKSYTNGNFDKLKRYTKIGTTLSILSTLPIFIICVYFTEDIIVLLWGEAFKAAVPILYILLAAQLFNVLCGSVGYLAIMTNHEKFVNKTILIAFILNFGLNILLIPKIGLIGAAWGTAIGIVFQNITLFFYMKRKHGFYALPSYSDLRNIIQEKLIK
jgi:O-antigen/teichoic acid export membrane protein